MWVSTGALTCVSNVAINDQRVVKRVPVSLGTGVPCPRDTLDADGVYSAPTFNGAWGLSRLSVQLQSDFGLPCFHLGLLPDHRF